jgi:aminoglycoside phosphotransferase (APT) family kinase protein
VSLVDVDRLTNWLDTEGLEAGLPIAVTPLSGGTSNAMFLVDRGAQHWVLRRPSEVALDRANEGMRREYRILSALETTAVPHPRAVALCEEHDVLGACFYLMERVDGVSPIPVPPQFDNDHDRAEIAFAMVEALARLHEVDWRAVGLGDLGHPEGFHERQVERWCRQLDSYQGRELPGIVAVTVWLEANLPARFEPTIMHGDFHMLNALIAVDPPGRVVAMIDWETATIGDPLLDLAGFCEIWCSVANDGWPNREALIERYRSVRSLDSLADLRYYDVLYNFRLSVLIEGIYQRSLKNPTVPDQDAMGEMALANLARALDLVQN